MTGAAKKAPTYQDVLDAPPQMVAEILLGELHSSLRRARRHGRVASLLGVGPKSAFGAAVGCLLLVACSGGQAVSPKPLGAEPAGAPASAKAAVAPVAEPHGMPEPGPDFPPSLGLQGLDWDGLVWRAGAWGKEGEPVEAWTAIARLASTYRGAKRPVEFTFDSQMALDAVVEPWGQPVLARGAVACRRFWFNPVLGIRVEEELKLSAADGECVRYPTRRPLLRFSPYTPLQTLLPSAIGTLPFQREGLVIGGAMGEFVKNDREVHHAPPVEDSDSDLEIVGHGREGTVVRIAVKSRHSAARVDLDQVKVAYARAFGAPTEEHDEGPIWLEYRRGDVKIDVGRNIGMLTMTSDACDLWDERQLKASREAAVEDWLRGHGAASGDSASSYRVRASLELGAAREATIERRIDSCTKELWEVHWEKPECAPAKTTAELILPSCCSPECGTDPKHQLVRLLDAATDRDTTELRKLLPPTGVVRAFVDDAGRRHSGTLSRGDLRAQSIHLLPTWDDVVDFGHVMCVPSHGDETIDVCTFGGYTHFSVSFRRGLLLSTEAWVQQSSAF